MAKKNHARDFLQHVKDKYGNRLDEMGLSHDNLGEEGGGEKETIDSRRCTLM